jgi:hypothetical protein
MNINTKTTLESKHFLSFSGAAQARLTQCLRNDTANIRPFSAPSEAIEAVKQGLNLVQPKNPTMQRITDGPNTFGQSMANAVVAYKLAKDISRAGQKLNNVVGRGTLARLDTDLKNDPSLPTPPVAPPVAPGTGSSSWRFHLFCDKNLFGRGEFVLNIVSQEDRQDSDPLQGSQFAMTEIVAASGLGSAFKGDTSGPFTTSVRAQVRDFSLAVVEFSLTRVRASRLRGTMQIQATKAPALSASFELPEFDDETGGTGQGSVVIRTVLNAGTF